MDQYLRHPRQMMGPSAAAAAAGYSEYHPYAMRAMEPRLGGGDATRGRRPMMPPSSPQQRRHGYFAHYHHHGGEWSYPNHQQNTNIHDYASHDGNAHPYYGGRTYHSSYPDTRARVRWADGYRLYSTGAGSSTAGHNQHRQPAGRTEYVHIDPSTMMASPATRHRPPSVHSPAAPGCSLWSKMAVSPDSTGTSFTPPLTHDVGTAEAQPRSPFANSKPCGGASPRDASSHPSAPATVSARATASRNETTAERTRTCRQMLDSILGTRLDVLADVAATAAISPDLPSAKSVDQHVMKQNTRKRSAPEGRFLSDSNTETAMQSPSAEHRPPVVLGTASCESHENNSECETSSTASTRGATASTNSRRKEQKLRRGAIPSLPHFPQCLARCGAVTKDRAKPSDQTNCVAATSGSQDEAIFAANKLLRQKTSTQEHEEAAAARTTTQPSFTSPRSESSTASSIGATSNSGSNDGARHRPSPPDDSSKFAPRRGRSKSPGSASSCCSRSRKKPKRRIGWNGHFALLLDYKLAHGNCNVPKRHGADPSLGHWVANQRRLRAAKLRGRGGGPRQTTPLTDEREQLLTKLGIEWKGIDAFDKDLSARWNAWYDELETFHRERGHCRVLRSDPRHRGLAFWVSRQRKEAADMTGTGRGGMTQERWDALDQLGFFDDVNWRMAGKVSVVDEDSGKEETSRRSSYYSED